MSDKEITQEEIDHDLAHENDDDEKVKKVSVTVDTKQKKVRPGIYVVSEFKRLVKVKADYELEDIIEGKLTPLADDAKITIKGGEVFVSHARQGGSS
ncbi:MAG: hypothetical protein JWM11_4416 [Planctomycetaceae bacterium]|nr:hypothetical protein [Planctomycetaceae bacterium]